LRRIGIPLACVIIMLGAMLAIATFSEQQNRRDALALSDDLLRELQRRIAMEVKGYLLPAAEMARLDALGDPVLTRAFNRFRIEGYGYRALDVDRRRYISTASSLDAIIGRHWSLFIVVPEDDFVGFVTRHNRQALALSLVIVSLASLLAGLLVVQGLRADRNAQLVLDRQQQLEAQSQAFPELASQATLFDPEDADSLVQLTAIAAGAVGVCRGESVAAGRRWRVAGL